MVLFYRRPTFTDENNLRVSRPPTQVRHRTRQNRSPNKAELAAIHRAELPRPHRGHWPLMKFPADEYTP